MDAIIENSKEVREWLENKDYSLSKVYGSREDLIFTTQLLGSYGTIRKYDFYRYSAKEHVIGGRIDCRGNFEKFKQVLSE